MPSTPDKSKAEPASPGAQPPLAFRVGVVGHRPDRLDASNPDQLRQALREVLWVIKDATLRFSLGPNGRLFADTDPKLRAVSSLAEGSDRLFAEEALAAGYALCCVMPFSLCGGRPDANLDSLLSWASAAFILDGRPTDPIPAYTAAGEVILSQSDFLVFVWDGEDRGLSGGTDQQLARARAENLPRVIVDAKAPHAWHLDDGGAYGDKGALALLVSRALELPQPLEDGDGEGSRAVALELDRYYREPATAKAPAFWRLFRTVLTNEAPQAAAWSATDPIAAALEPYYQRLDNLAGLYSDRYRSAFLSMYLLGALAVGAALAPLTAPKLYGGTVALAWAELLAMTVVLTLVFWGRRASWHERWMDYRLGAEFVRHLRIVSAVGGTGLYPPTPGHQATYGQPAATWMGWYVKALSRGSCPPSLTLDPKAHCRLLREMERLLLEQLRYQRSLHAQSHGLDHRLHIGVIACLVITLAGCLAHALGLRSFGETPLFVCGFFPAVGASLAGVANQAELRRVSKRSKAMEQQLAQAWRRSRALRWHIVHHPLDFHYRSVRSLVQEVAWLLVQEVNDWRVVFIDRPLELEV